MSLLTRHCKIDCAHFWQIFLSCGKSVLRNYCELIDFKTSLSAFTPTDQTKSFLFILPSSLTYKTAQW